MAIQCVIKSSDHAEYCLSDKDVLEVPEKRYSLLITNIPKEQKYILRFNDDNLATLNTTEFSMIIDLINAIGYNRLEIVTSSNVIISRFDFFTSTAKLLRDEFYRMVDFVFNNIISNKGQFVYYDKNKAAHKIVNPLFVFNWIDKHFDEIESLVLWIKDNAQIENIIHNKTSFSVTNRYCKKATMSYYRNNRDILLKNNNNTGLIRAAGQSFDPQAFVAKKSIQHYKLNEHIQIFELLSGIYWFLSNLDKHFGKLRYQGLREELYAKLKKNNWLDRLSFLRKSYYLAEISAADIKYIRRAPISTLQLSNQNYGNIYLLYKNFISNHYRFIDEHKVRYYQHIKNIDSVYESFSCYVLADILDLKNTETDHLVTGKAFFNDEYSLYYHSKPPCMKGWALSDTPDIVLMRNSSRKYLILDCKFKVKDGNVKGEDVQKLQAYLNNYFQQEGAVIYPGNDLGAIEDNIKYTYRLLKIPIRPWNENAYLKKKQEIRLLLHQTLS